MLLQFPRLPLARSTVHRYQQITMIGAGAVTVMTMGIGMDAEAIGTAAAGADPDGADPDGAGVRRPAPMLAGSEAASDTAHKAVALPHGRATALLLTPKSTGRAAKKGTTPTPMLVRRRDYFGVRFEAASRMWTYGSGDTEIDPTNGCSIAKIR